MAVTPTLRVDGAYLGFRGLRREWETRHYMLRYPPDVGSRESPVANYIKQEGFEVPSGTARSLTRVRFQLVVSTGFRTTLVEPQEPVPGPRIARDAEIIPPRAGARMLRENPVSLGAMVTGLLLVGMSGA